MKPSRILVCGGRDYDKRDFLFQSLDSVRHHFAQDFCIIQGEALGADLMARAWAELNGVCCIGVRAPWKNYHKRAGGIRNGWMATFCMPELLIAFPGCTGTRNMVNTAKKARIPIWQP